MPPAPDGVAARLAADADPAIRALARRDLLGDAAPDEDVLRSPIVRGLLAGLEDGAVLERPYAKWTGAHWRLISLVELGVPPGTGPRCERRRPCSTTGRRPAASPGSRSWTADAGCTRPRK